jgi:hypothetical protein
MRKKRSLPLLILLFGGVLILSILALAFIPRLLSTREVNPENITNQDQVPRVTVDEAYEAMVSGEAVLVDTRSEAQFASSRAAGAINIPIDQVELRLGELDPDTWFITYCT